MYDSTDVPIMLDCEKETYKCRFASEIEIINFPKETDTHCSIDA